MGMPYIPFQPRTLDELAQSAQSFDPIGGGPANLARMLMPDIGNVAMPEDPKQERRQRASGFKQLLGDFLYSLGQGLAAGGGTRGAGVALLAPTLRRQQQEQQEMEAAAAAQQQAQAQRKQQFDELNILSQIQARAQGPEAARPQHIGGGYVLYPDGRIEKAGPEEPPPQATTAGLQERWANLEARKGELSVQDEALRQALGRIVGPEAKGEGVTPFNIQEYEYAKKQGYKGTLADWKKLVAETYGDIRFQMMIDTATGRPTVVFPNDPSRQLTVPAPLLTPEFAGKAAEAKAIFASADGMLRQIEELANKVITAQGPLEAAGQYATTTLGAAARTNTDAAVFLTTKDAFGSMLTRAAGQTGVLTQQDVEYILRALPAPGDTVAIAQGKMLVFRALYRGIVDAKLSAYGAAPLPGGTSGTPGGAVEQWERGPDGKLRRKP